MGKEKLYAAYRGDTFLVVGTAQECADYLGIKRTSFYFLMNPAYERRLKKVRDAITAIRVEDDDD